MLDEDTYQVALRLDKHLERLYRRGYRRFLCGGALGFDQLAAERVLLLRERYPEARLILVLPCSQQSRFWPDEDKRRYTRIIQQCDETRILSYFYYEGCMLVRNRHMVDRSSLCLCYLKHPKGGTMSTVAYASQNNVTIVNLAMPCDPANHLEKNGQ